jgi:hypothetical protein
VSSLRAPVERAIATLKTWRVLFTDYRRQLKTFTSSFHAATGLYFFKEIFGITFRDRKHPLVDRDELRMPARDSLAGGSGPVKFSGRPWR